MTLNDKKAGARKSRDTLPLHAFWGLKVQSKPAFGFPDNATGVSCAILCYSKYTIQRSPV